MNNSVVSEIRDFLGVDMLEIHGYCGFFEWVLYMESQTEMEVQNFIPFCYWKGAKFAENIHVILQKWTILSVLQTHRGSKQVCCKDLWS